MNFSRHSRWSGFPDETRKTIYWYEKRPDTQVAGFLAELFTHVGQLGDARRSACSFHQRAVHRRSDRSQGNDPAPGGCRCTRRGREKSGLHFSLERVKKMGKRPRASTRWRVRSDADRLVETLARCGENGKQRREWRCLLSGLEPARLKISLPGPSDHRVRARDDGYRSWNRHYKGRLLARNLPVEYEPLSDRAAHESRSSSRIGRSLSSRFAGPKC